MNEEKLLVIGGSGFIGSHFIKYIMKKYPYISIINYDSLLIGDVQNLSETFKGDERYNFVEGDIKDISNLENIIKTYQIDIVINFAVEYNYEDAKESLLGFETNIVGVVNLLFLIKKYNIKLLQISTAQIFGSQNYDDSTELSKFEPNNLYAASKAGANLVCQAYIESYKVKVITANICHIMGTYQSIDHIIPNFIIKALQEKKIQLINDGLNVREWMYIDDCSRGLEIILNRGVWGESYNMGSNIRKADLDLANIILKKLNKSESLIEYISDIKTTNKKYSINSDKLRNLGWEPVFDFNQSINRLIEWYSNESNLIK